MAVDVIMPQMGESIFEGTITKWLKKPGDRIERDEPLFEISTDKVDAEIPAPFGRRAEGNQGHRGADRADPDGSRRDRCGRRIGGRRRGCRAPVASPGAGKGGRAQGRGAPPAPLRACSCAGARRSLRRPLPAAPAPRAATARKIRSSPLVRRLAKEHNVDLAGDRRKRRGRAHQQERYSCRARIGRRAACGARRQRAPSSSVRGSRQRRPPAGGAMAHPALENAVPRERIYFGNYEAQPMSVMRQRIAEHMVASKRVSPHVYSIDEADMTRIAKIRERSKAAFETKYGTKLTYMPFFVRACVEGLRAFPDRQRIGRRNDDRAAPRNQRGHRRGARLGADRARAQERRGEKFPGPGARHQRSRRARPREEAQARGGAGRQRSRSPTRGFTEG